MDRQLVNISFTNLVDTDPITLAYIKICGQK